MSAWLYRINFSLFLTIGILGLPFVSTTASLESGIGWQNIGPGGGGWIEALAVDPSNSEIVYAGCDVGGILKSIDGGETWQTSNQGLENDFVRDIVIDPKDSEVIYLATPAGIHKSIDAGKSWLIKRSGFPAVSQDDFSAPINVLAIAPQDSTILYAGIGHRESHGAGQLYKSLDAGESWFIVNAPNEINPQAVIHSICIHPAETNVTYIGTDYGVYKSLDGGKTWENKNKGLAHLDVREIAISKKPPYRLFLTNRRGVYLSEDQGENWEVLNQGLHANYYPLEISPDHPDTCYVGDVSWTSAGLYKTPDAGKTWIRSTAYQNIVDYGWLTQWGLGINCIALAPSNPQVIYVGTSGHIFKSSNASKSWRQVYTKPNGQGTYSTRGLETTCIHSITIDQKDAKTIYAGYFDIGLMKSIDAGMSFQRIVKGMDYENSVFIVVIDPDNPSVLYAGIGEWSENKGSFCISQDGGKSWRVIGKKPDLPEGRVRFICIDPQSPAKSRDIYVGVDGQGVFKTQNNGRNWISLNSGFNFQALRALLLQPENPQTLYVATGRTNQERGGIYLSKNKGRPWERIQTNIEFPNIQTMTFDPHDADVLYLGCREYYDSTSHEYFPGGLYKSMDGGKSWVRLLEDKFVSSIAIDPYDAKVIYVACPDHNYHDLSRGRGILRSKDSGRTWEFFNENLGSLRINALAISPTKPSTIYCGSAGNGLFKREGI